MFDLNQSSGVTRRQVAGGLAALGATAIFADIAPTVAASKRQRIDVHHHFVPTEVMGSPHIVHPLKEWTVERSLDDMEQGRRYHVDAVLHAPGARRAGEWRPSHAGALSPRQ